MCASFAGTINLSSPTSAFPVARMRFSPFAVSGISDVPVCLPLRDHSVSPWRTMKTRGVGILLHCTGLCRGRNAINEGTENENVGEQQRR